MSAVFVLFANFAVNLALSRCFIAPVCFTRITWSIRARDNHCILSLPVRIEDRLRPGMLNAPIQGITSSAAEVSRRAIAPHRADMRGRGGVLRYRPRPGHSPRLRRVLHRWPPTGLRHRRSDTARHRLGNHRDMVGRTAPGYTAGSRRPRRAPSQAVGKVAGPAGCVPARAHGGVCPCRRGRRMAARVQQGGFPRRPDCPRAAAGSPCAVPRRPVAHSASYLVGLVGGMVVMLLVWRSRGRAARAPHAEPDSAADRGRM